MNRTEYTKKETAANRKLLADALESNRFKQGRRYLCYEEEKTMYYCCLGVACELAMENGIRLGKRKETTSGVYHYIGSNRQELTGVLPYEVMKWLGFADNNGMLILSIENTSDDNEVLFSLVDANDTSVPFPEIAKLIKKGKVRLEL